jgi:hypothetical protein
LEDFRQRAANIVIGAEHPNYTAALDQINGLFEVKFLPLQWDKEKRTINILDPHFYFFLRTKVAEALA